MDQKLKDNLPQLTLEELHRLDGGKLVRQFNRAMARVFDNIGEFPIRNGKPEQREITIRLLLEPEVRMTKKPIESAYGTSEVDVPEICGVAVKAVVRDKLPIFETGTVSMAVEVKNGRIIDARFNPNNSANPNQLELFDDDLAVTLDDEDE